MRIQIVTDRERLKMLKESVQTELAKVIERREKSDSDSDKLESYRRGREASYDHVLFMLKNIMSIKDV